MQPPQSYQAAPVGQSWVRRVLPRADLVLLALLIIGALGLAAGEVLQRDERQKNAGDVLPGNKIPEIPRAQAYFRWD